MYTVCRRSKDNAIRAMSVIVQNIEIECVEN